LAASTWHGPHALQSVALDPRTLADVDAVVLTADHTSFRYQLLAERGVNVIDTRNALRRAASEEPDALRLGALGAHSVAAAPDSAEGFNHGSEDSAIHHRSNPHRRGAAPEFPRGAGRDAGRAQGKRV